MNLRCRFLTPSYTGRGEPSPRPPAKKKENRSEPLGIVADMKADPALAAIPTVGFVSHVRTDVIDAARQAGVGDIMARSAFTVQLPEILRRT